MFNKSDDLFHQTGDMAHTQCLVEVGFRALYVLILFLRLLFLQVRLCHVSTEVQLSLLLNNSEVRNMMLIM